MKRLLLVFLASCVTTTAAGDPPANEPLFVRKTMLAEHASGFFVGRDVVVSIVSQDRPVPHVRVARLGDNGDLVDVASEVPASAWVRTRRDRETVSGYPVGFFETGHAELWMAFTHYAAFGATEMFRVQNGRWTPAPLPAVAVAPKMGTSPGDVMARHSRGHLFKLENRTSGEGPWFRFPNTVVATYGPEPTPIPWELIDGSIVKVDARSVAGVSRADYWVLGLDGRTLHHVVGDREEPVDLPASDMNEVFVDPSGDMWIAGAHAIHRRFVRGVPSPAWSDAIALGFESPRILRITDSDIFALDEVGTLWRCWRH